MSICEIIEADTGVLRRIEFYPDGKVEIMKSHTISYKNYIEQMYILGQISLLNFERYVWKEEPKNGSGAESNYRGEFSLQHL